MVEDSMNIKEIVERIGYFRTKKNLSARELSMQIGKAPGYINKLEQIKFNLTTEVLLEIIDALEIKPEEFFADNYMTFALDKSLYNTIKNLPPEKKQYLIDFLNK